LSRRCVRDRLVASLSTSCNNGVILSSCYKVVIHKLQDDNKLLEQLVTSLLSSTTLQHLVNKLLTKHPDDKLLEQHCYKSAVALSQLARFYTCVDASIHSSRADVIPIAKDKIT
jgi:hypothetical protein